MVPDDIMVDDDLDMVDVFGSRSNTDANDDRNLRLMQKSKEASRKRAQQVDSYAIDVARENLIETLCPNCGHVFYRKPDEEDLSCPYCQAKHHFEGSSPHVSR